MRVFKSKDSDQELAAAVADSPIIRQSLSIDKTTDFAVNKSNSQFQTSEPRGIGDLDDNQPISTRREHELNSGNKVKMYVPQVENDNDELLCALNKIDEMERRKLPQSSAHREKDNHAHGHTFNGKSRAQVKRKMKN